MIIIPAIDIREGKVVRLLKGDFSKQTTYSDKPEDVALKWQKEGAKMLHVVDLDGALTGKLKNIDSIEKIRNAIDIPMEVGGGIRTIEDIKKLIDIKVERVILSTLACDNRHLLEEALISFKDKIAIGLDAKNNQVMIRGWKESSNLDIFEFAGELEELGVKRVIYTDIESDGTLRGVRLERIKDFLLKTNLLVIASGGISSIEDLKNLKKLEKYGLEGAIIGKALYDKKISLTQALKIS